MTGAVVEHAPARRDGMLKVTAMITRLGVHRIHYETLTYFRSADEVASTFLFPPVLLLVFSAAYSRWEQIAPAVGAPGVSIATYFLPGIVSAGILLSGLQTLAVEIARERHNGTLLRLASTPLTSASYLIGKFGLVLVCSSLQLGLVLTTAYFVLGVELPAWGPRWATMAWLYLFGLAAMSLLGIALSRAPRSARSASAVVVPVVVLLQFISGVYIQVDVLPDWLRHTAAIFPVAWISRGMRSVFLPSDFASVEIGGAWELPSVALALSTWFVIGLLAAATTFRWVKARR